MIIVQCERLPRAEGCIKYSPSLQKANTITEKRVLIDQGGFQGNENDRAMNRRILKAEHW